MKESKVAKLALGIGAVIGLAIAVKAKDILLKGKEYQEVIDVSPEEEKE